MSNKTSINVLGVEFTRFIAVCEGQEFYFAEKKSDVAIKTALGHFPNGKVLLGIQDTPESLYDVSDLREVVSAEQIEVEVAAVVEVVKKRGARNPPRNSNHSPRQAAYFGL